MGRRRNHRERLLEGALQCLQEKGYARTTSRDIAAAARSNLGSIGYHFGSKEALLNEAISRAFADWIEQLAKAAFVEGGATPLERARASWVALQETLKEHRALMVAFVEAMAQAERSPGLRRDLAKLYEEGRTAVGALVEASLGDSPLSGPQVRAAASLLIAVCDGFVLQWLVDPDGAPNGEELAAGVEAALVAALPADRPRDPHATPVSSAAP